VPSSLSPSRPEFCPGSDPAKLQCMDHQGAAIPQTIWRCDPLSLWPGWFSRHSVVPADQDELLCVWSELDRCQRCRDQAYALPDAPSPGRPFLAPRDECILFIGEAPPRGGGFWKPGNSDELRERLLTMLPEWPYGLERHSVAALERFVDAGYFFVQAMKWPLRASYNSQRTTSRVALQHALASHLENEIEAINPKGIIALGAAAMEACTALSKKHGLHTATRAGVDAERLHHHVFRMGSGRDVPLHTTRLPGRQNDRFKWASIIAHDLKVFGVCLKAPPTAGRGRSKADRNREAHFAREALRRLKAAGLWPPPEGRPFEEIMVELERRESDSFGPRISGRRGPDVSGDVDSGKRQG